MATLRTSSSQNKPTSSLRRGKPRSVRGGAAVPDAKPSEIEPPSAQRVDISAIPGVERAPMPRRVEPQLATRAPFAPAGDSWLHEIKFDGYRLLARIDRKDLRLFSRNGKDWTDRFPNLSDALANLELGEAILDGELVALQADGTSSFRQLQESLAAKRTSGLIFEVFDLLYLGGFDFRKVELETRKLVLRDLFASRDLLNHRGPIRYVHHFEGKGEELFDEVCQLGLEGIMCKQRSSLYRPGRTTDWLKVKCIQQGEFVVGGYTDPSNARIGFGALLLGAYNEQGQLRYIGSVGTGFSAQTLRSLYQTLRELEIDTSPFTSDGPRPDMRGVHWVRPELVADVEFTEWTRDGSLRHPVFRGLREDKSPVEITLSADAPSVLAHAEAQLRNGRTMSHSLSRAGSDSEVAGVRLTHPDRIMYPDQGITKLHLARYYEQVQDEILPYLVNRPLTLVRCPDGSGKPCFYQKHPPEGLSDAVRRVPIEESSGPAIYLYVDSLQGIVALVQIGVLELHCWGSRVETLETPDYLVFDLDPGPGVTWPRLIEGARMLQDRLDGVGLPAFPKLTGGKGLHLVVPLVPERSWDDVKEFCRAVAEGLARERPDRFTSNMAKTRRQARIFIDYLRNGRGATAIAPYSTRARPGAPVAVPIGWDELDPASRSDRYGIDAVRRRLAALRKDPWADFERSRARITKQMRKAVGLEG